MENKIKIPLLIRDIERIELALEECGQEDTVEGMYGHVLFLQQLVSQLKIYLINEEYAE